ncbi:hypothetical protein NA57DRAFT_32577 [Rhizodiscina lignyota]|uniref:Heterokaryon incompatibility domain-containing protein n=1 Tax=Rhizodiscina lignyota TaxID=1504668 RepID=A0A9P4MD36_9PEZI|nr:hypothetical protein NA57DRAFT_32577 [Rhizodiscina lignyota]
MGDVYKFAWLNVAALSTASDYEGFINDTRDRRVEFGFRAPFASILGRDQEEKNSNGQECVLLRGTAKLLWKFSADIPGSNARNAPLFKRAWVYQERSLARRTLAFTKNSVYWACDECSWGERPDWGVGGLESEGLRGTLHSVLDTLATLKARNARDAAGQGQRIITPEQGRELIQGFDLRWYLSVTSYTLCKLTKHTDKLIAISSVARELANSRLIGKRYLAGLWDVNLTFQMAWITVEGKTTPPKKRVADDEYVAPSWSWASVEAPVQPRFIFNSRNDMIALADVRAAEVSLETDYVYGSVKAGWLRVYGRLNRIKAAGWKGHNSWDKTTKSAYLTDEATGETLWFCSDTVEGYQLVQSGKGIDKLVWMPLTLRFGSNMLACTCLCLIEAGEQEGIGTGDGFVKQDEKVYRRLGTGDFGRLPSMLRQDKLLVGLGAYPDIQVKDGQGQELAQGFRRNEEELEEFVLI